MAAKKDIEKKVKLREFQRSVNQLLSTEDRDYLFYALREYNTYKSVAKLMLALNSCLDTPEKLDLLPYIRDLIPKHDKKKFDSLAPYNRMAHPLALQVEQSHTAPAKLGETAKSYGRASTRVVNLQRPPGTPLGFSIRGGVEHNLGIYLSHVDSFSLAEKSGLKVGDQIVNVNGIDFNRVSHSSAVLVLKSHDNLRIEVKNTGIMPGQKMDRNSILWVDPSGKPVEDTDDVPGSPLLEKREEVSGGRLLTSSQRHKIVLHAQKKKDLGFSVRGGQEYGLGIYVSAVDSGSPAEEAGLQVGDQVMDVNGHSFISIQHQEAVHILRSYQNLILTIKSLGRIPKLASSPERTAPKEGTEANPSSPHTRRRASSFLKSLKSKLSTHAEEEEEEEEEEEKKQSHMHAKEDTPQSRPRSKSTTLQRSQSVKTRGSEKRQPASLNGTTGHLDLARSSNADSAQQKSNSAGSSPVLPRTFQTRKQMSISPLATHEARAASSPVAGGEGKFTVTPKFFEKGVGTQVMLSSTTSSLAKELLFDKARRLLEEDEVDSLRDNAQQYETNGDIETFAHFLISILDTPEKINLLTEVRSVLSPSDIVHFDQIVSPQEVKVLQHAHSSGTDEDSDEDPNEAQNYQMVLNAIKYHNGHQGLRKTHPEQFTRKSHRPNFGAYGNAKAQSLLNRAATESVSEPDLLGLQTKESFLAWNDDEQNERMGASMSALPITSKATVRTKPSTPPQMPSRNPVIVDITKSAAYLGMSLESRGDQRIRVRDIREGGIIAKDGFIKAGFEIVEVDGKRLRGKSQSEATHLVAEAFNNTNQTMTFIVIPTH